MNIIKKEMKKRSKVNFSEHLTNSLSSFLEYLYDIECKLKEQISNQLTYSDKKAKKFLDKTVPAVLKQIKPGEYVLFTPCYLKRKNYHFIDNLFGKKFSDEIGNYLRNKYEIQGYTKEIRPNSRHFYFIEK